MSRFLLLGLAVVGLAEEEGCTITAARCKNFPEFEQKQFRDQIGEEHVGAGKNEAACLKRAEDFHHWCGNGVQSGAQVAATYGPAKWTQVYHPGACESGWSQWDAFCYKHYWEKKTWFEAEALCRDRNSHLASIHSRAENRFIYTLTGGLSAWIGYTDLDQDTHYQWSDNTQDDFTNFAKNCTGRESDPDCHVEERKQQWYDWENHDAGTFICKRNALLPLSILRNVSASELLQKPWSSFLPVLAGPSAAAPKHSLGAGQPASAEAGAGLPNLELKVDPFATSPAVAGEAGKPAAPEPRLFAPKGSFF